MIARFGLWKDRKYHLDRMSLRELVVAYFQYYAIQAYILVALVSLGLAVHWMTAPVPVVIAGLAAVLIYPLVWYVLHRLVLHGQFLYRSPVTAAVWKRIHFDHHQDPHDLRVLFGALYTTLPTVALSTMPVGWLIAGPAGAATGLGVGALVTCFYEFSHCIQHLSYKPKWGYLRRIKQRHMEHHFHNENGNFGITNFLWDHLLGTYYEKTEGARRSATVFNIGYTPEMARRYPWVAQLSGGVLTDNPRQRRQPS